MTIEPTGKGVVMFGPTFDGCSEEWFERWFSTTEKAKAYAAKRGWWVERYMKVST
jgi:hypothetical protein